MRAIRRRLRRGVVALHKTIDLGRVETIVDLMTTEQQQVIYLHIARRSAIDGLTALSQFVGHVAPRKAQAMPSDDPRALLYSALANVATEPVEQLQAIWRASTAQALGRRSQAARRRDGGRRADDRGRPPAEASRGGADSRRRYGRTDRHREPKTRRRVARDRQAGGGAAAEPTKPQVAEAAARCPRASSTRTGKGRGYGTEP
jgi:hypothetical protein